MPQVSYSPATASALIKQIAPRYGLDPMAALRVASGEGLGGGIGDQGTSFGPFQLHAGGALPANIWARGAAFADQWAKSYQGIDYALRGMAADIPRGLTGNAAIAAMVRNFERPADPASEIARDLGRPVSSLGSGYAVPTSSGAGGVGPNPGTFINRVLMRSPGASEPTSLMNALMAYRRASLAAGNPLAGGPSFAGGPGGRSGAVTVAPGANRRGVGLSQGILDFAHSVAGIYGPLTITTGSNHNQFVVGTNRQSAHWTGNAADIAASGPKLTRMGQDALIAAGMPAAKARQQTGGLYNIGGYQIIFNSNEGGNHFNHLHIGLHGGG